MFHVARKTAFFCNISFSRNVPESVFFFFFLSKGKLESVSKIICWSKVHLHAVKTLHQNLVKEKFANNVTKSAYLNSCLQSSGQCRRSIDKNSYPWNGPLKPFLFFLIYYKYNKNSGPILTLFRMGHFKTAHGCGGQHTPPHFLPSYNLSPEISNFCYIKKHGYRLHLNSYFLILLFFLSL